MRKKNEVGRRGEGHGEEVEKGEEMKGIDDGG